MQFLNTINYCFSINMPNYSFVSYKFFHISLTIFKRWFGSFISSVNYFAKVDTNKRNFKKVNISNFTTLFIFYPFDNFIFVLFPLMHSNAGRFYYSAMINSINSLQLLIGTMPATFDKLVNIFEHTHIPSVVAGFLFAIKQLYINLIKIQNKIKKETFLSLKESKMIAVKKNVNRGDVAIFFCESRIKNNRQYLIGDSEDFAKKIDIEIYQNEFRENSKSPILFIFDSEKNKIGYLSETDGRIKIDDCEYRCGLERIEVENSKIDFILRVSIMDDAIKSKMRSEKSEDGELEGERERIVGEGEFKHVEYY